MSCQKSFRTHNAHNFCTVLIMQHDNLLFSIVCKLMAVSIMLSLVVFPMHDEIDNHGLEKDVAISSHAGHFVEHKAKKHAANFYAALENVPHIFSYKPEIPEPLAMISFFDFFHSFSSRILRL